MGEIADMMIDGLLDSVTGELIDGDAPGYPRTKYKPLPKLPRQHSCKLCGKRFRTMRGVKDHTKAVHAAEGGK
jgi:hypothetical protein